MKKTTLRCRMPMEYEDWLYSIKQEFIKAGYSAEIAGRMCGSYRGLYYDYKHYVPAKEIVEKAVQNPLALSECDNPERLLKWFKRRKLAIPKILLFEE